MLPVGIVSTGGLKVTPEDEEQEIILKGKEWGDGARSMYKLGSVVTLYCTCVYISTNKCNSMIYMKCN